MSEHNTNPRSRTPKFFEIRNFDSLQHRVTDSRTGEQKSLPWIKLYHSLLDDPDFEQLPDDTKFHYIGLLLLARKIGNYLPYNAEYLARKIAANSRINLELLLQRKFILPCKRNKTQGEKYAPSMHRKRTEDALDRDKTETETETTTDETAHSASPVAGGVVVGNFGQTSSVGTANGKASRHTRAEVMAHLDDCARRGQQFTNKEGLCAKLLRTGEADETIQDFLDRRARASLDTSQCPRCGGAGMYYPDGFERGVARCKHEPLLNPTIAIEHQRVSA
jgi:hypothetical protein